MEGSVFTLILLFSMKIFQIGLSGNIRSLRDPIFRPVDLLQTFSPYGTSPILNVSTLVGTS